jgi:hypothetical protein
LPIICLLCSNSGEYYQSVIDIKFGWTSCGDIRQCLQYLTNLSFFRFTFYPMKFIKNFLGGLYLILLIIIIQHHFEDNHNFNRFDLIIGSCFFRFFLSFVCLFLSFFRSFISFFSFFLLCLSFFGFCLSLFLSLSNCPLLWFIGLLVCLSQRYPYLSSKFVPSLKLKLVPYQKSNIKTNVVSPLYLQLIVIIK